MLSFFLHGTSLDNETKKVSLKSEKTWSIGFKTLDTILFKCVDVH